MISRPTVILGIATCLSVVAGMLAPDVMCDVQSRIDTEGTETFTTKQIVFEPADHGSVLPALRLLREAEMTYEMENGTRLTPDEAIGSAVDISNQLAASGYGVSLESRVIDADASPYLYVSQVGGISGIIWTCAFALDDGESTAYVCVDDSTGKAVTYEETSYRTFDELIMGESEEPSFEDMRSWLEIWGAYWGVDISVDALGGDGVAAAIGLDAVGIDEEDGEKGALATAEDRVFQEKLEREADDEDADISVSEAIEPYVIDVETSDDPRALGKLTSKLLVDENGLEELSALYDGLSVEVLGTLDEDPEVDLVVEWRIGVSSAETMYELWMMTVA